MKITHLLRNKSGISLPIWLLICVFMSLQFACISAKSKQNKEPKPAPYNTLLNNDDAKGKGANEDLKKGLVPDPFQAWIQRDCMPLRRLLNHKSFADRRLVETVNNVLNDKEMSDIEKKYQVLTIRIFSQELNETASSVIESLEWIDQVLRGDFRNLASLQEKSLARLTYLKEAVLKEEREYHDIMEAQEGLDKINTTRVKGVMDQILREVSQAADQLEELLNENLFKIAVKDGAILETVVKLRSGEQPDQSEAADRGSKGGAADKARNKAGEVVKLVDSQDNQFVLAKGSDSTVPLEDHHLIKDVVYIFCCALLFGSLCTGLRLPPMFGYIVAGVVLGPSMLNAIKSQVQIETLGQFGVFFILLFVGMEFSPAQLSKTIKIAVPGTLLLTLLMLLCGLVVGRLVDTTANEAVFVAACLSLSSTPLVFKFLNPGHPGDTDSPATTDFGSALLGILIMQDVLLGLIMAALPVLANTDPPDQSEASSHVVTYIVLLVRLLVALSVVVFVALVAARFLIGRALTLALRRCPHEITLVLVVVCAFCMMALTDSIGISMELGCFLAGVMVSAQSSELVDSVELLLTPLKDFLSVIFFASIGLHVFPTFMVYEVTILTTLTMATVAGKYLLCVLVLACLTRRAPAHIKWIVSAGLAQVSEFSFVLGSKARRLGLISREVYLLILSVTTLSLVFAPVLWKVTVWRLRIKGNAGSGADLHTSPTVASPVCEQPPATVGTKRTISPVPTRRLKLIQNA